MLKYIMLFALILKCNAHQTLEEYEIRKPITIYSKDVMEVDFSCELSSSPESNVSDENGSSSSDSDSSLDVLAELSLEPNTSEISNQMLDHITHLNYNYFDLTYDLLNKLSNYKNLIYLNLRGTGINQTIMEQIIEFLKNCKIQHIDISDNPINDQGIESLFEVYKLNPNIHTIVYYNTIHKSWNYEVIDRLLNKQQNSILWTKSAYIDHIILINLAMLLKHRSSLLTSLMISGAVFAKNIGKIIAFIMNHSHKLRNLTLRECNLQEQDAKEIAACINHHPSLTSIDISKNTSLKSEQAQYFIDKLTPNCPLKNLFLSDNYKNELTIMNKEKEADKDFEEFTRNFKSPHLVRLKTFSRHKKSHSICINPPNND